MLDSKVQKLDLICNYFEVMSFLIVGILVDILSQRISICPIKSIESLIDIVILLTNEIHFGQVHCYLHSFGKYILAKLPLKF
jgi:hypothetical protein